MCQNVNEISSSFFDILQCVGRYKAIADKQIQKQNKNEKERKEVKNHGLQKSKKYDCQKDSRGTRKRSRGRAGKRRQWQYGKNCHPAYDDAGKETTFNLDLTFDMVLISKAL